MLGRNGTRRAEFTRHLFGGLRPDERNFYPNTVQYTKQTVALQLRRMSWNLAIQTRKQKGLDRAKVKSSALN